jgi:hypothetical protein
VTPPPAAPAPAPTEPDPAPAAAPAVPAPSSAATASTAPAIPAPAAEEGGNIADDNSDDITATSEQKPSIEPNQTLTWNWDWNCDEASQPDGVPQLPAGAAAIVWNWHWSCGDVAPPSLSNTGVTVCLSCNIAVSVRIASPGDSAAVSQATGVGAAADAGNVATTIQTVTQTVVQAAGPPPEPVVVPALPAVPLPLAPWPPAIPPPLVPLPPSVPFPRVPSFVAQGLVPATIEMGLASLAPPAFLPDAFALAQDSFVQGSRRHSASRVASVHVASSHVRRIRSSISRARGGAALGVSTARTFVLTQTRVAAFAVVVDGRKRVARAGNAAPATTAPRLPPPRRAPAAPTPITMVPSANGVPDGGGFTTAALGVGSLGAFLLLLLSYAAPGRRTVRSRAADAHPDPPG